MNVCKCSTLSCVGVLMGTLQLTKRVDKRSLQIRVRFSDCNVIAEDVLFSILQQVRGNHSACDN